MSKYTKMLYEQQQQAQTPTKSPSGSSLPGTSQMSAQSVPQQTMLGRPMTQSMAGGALGQSFKPPQIAASQQQPSQRFDPKSLGTVGNDSACEQSFYSQKELTQQLSVQQSQKPEREDFSSPSSSHQSSMMDFQVSRKLDNTFGGAQANQSQIISPVNDTKMTDNEAFQAFLSKQDNQGEDSDY